jgi:hypothetical protein
MVMRWGKPTKNKKRSDPRYFLNENVEEQDISEGPRDKAKMAQSAVAPNPEIAAQLVGVLQSVIPRMDYDVQPKDAVNIMRILAQRYGLTIVPFDAVNPKKF